MFSDESETDSPSKRKTSHIKKASSSDDLEITAVKKRKSKFCIESSDSDSDSSFERVVFRKKKLRVVNSDSDSSDSDMARVSTGKNLRRIIVDEYSSSDSSWSSDGEGCNINGSNATTSKMVDKGATSDSSNGHSEKCPICLLSFKGQEIASPETCDHVFCAVCIEEWSKNVNTCPVDRLVFGMILVRDTVEGKVTRQIVVHTPTKNNLELLVDVPFDTSLACEFCGSSDNDHTMLLCDGCNLGFHMECLEPPLTELPDGDWYCPTCQGYGIGRHYINEFADVADMNEDQIDEANRGIEMRRNEGSRWFPRTGQTERAIRRVRQRIYNIVQEHRVNRTTDAEYVLRLRSEVNNTNSPARNRKKKKLKKSKNKRQRRALRAKKNSKRRLAAQLGISNSQGLLHNTSNVASNQNPIENISFQRRMAGIPQLHLFGRRDELDYFSSSDSENNNESYQTSTGSTSCLLLTRLGMPSTSYRRNIKAKTTTDADVLGSILESQAKFHSKNYALSLTNDGRIKLDRKNLTYKTKQTSLVTESDSTTPSSTNNSGNDGSSATDRSSPSAHGTNDYQRASGPSSASSGLCSTPDDADQVPIDYSLPQTNNTDEKKKDKNLYNPEEANSGASDSELDIYSDIETVTTSRTEDTEINTPIMQPDVSFGHSADYINENESDTDLVIDDTEKAADQDKYDPASIFESDDEKTEAEPAVTSTVDSTGEGSVAETLVPNVSINSEIQSNTVQSSSSNNQNALKESDDEELLEDDCPNFNIYSTESINMAKSNDLAMMVVSGCKEPEIPSQNTTDNSSIKDITITKEVESRIKKCSMSFYSVGSGLYSDSEDENVIKIDRKKPFGINDLQTEDISEEERSYTPCLDEKEPQQQQQQFQEKHLQREGGLEGLDTEMISDDDKNDFDDANDPKTTSDGDALEINAKESELDFTRTEECEEGEIVDKTKKINDNEEVKQTNGKEKNEEEPDDSNKENETQKKDPSNASNSTIGNKEQGTAATFKKISKSQRERNYRENRSYSRSRSRENKKNKTSTDGKERRKRKEIEIYNVRSILSDKPRRVKDQFGRDVSRRLSDSDSSNRSLTPPPQSPVLSGRRPFHTDSSPLNVTRNPARSRSRSLSSFHTPNRRRSRSRSYSPATTLAPRRSPSHGRRSRSKEKKKRKRTNKSRSMSLERRRSYSIRKKSINRSRSNKEKKRRKSSQERYKVKGKKARSRSPRRQRSSSPRSPSLRRRDWERRNSRGWTPSLSPSSPISFRRLSPSWTPPRLLNQPPVKPQNLTVILTNDANKKSKKDKKKKSEKRGRDVTEKSSKKRKRDKSPAPSKEVFASGNNILVSVSFNKDADNIRDVQASRKRYETTSELTTKRLRKEREKKNSSSVGTSNNNKNATLARSEKTERKQKMANVKPVAIIDLELSPFRELTPSPQDIIVLTDSENGDSNDHIAGLQKNVIMCDSSSQQISSPPPPTINAYNSAGPKTPPEPQVKFSLSSKQSQMRPIINPLHEPDDVDDEPIEQRRDEDENQVMYKGPNTPPEPPNSPPSSPDAYDPFDPTKSRTPTPEPAEPTTQSNNSSIPALEDTNTEGDKVGSGGGMVSSATPPDVRPADSQSTMVPSTPDAKISPERSIGVIINQVVVQNQQQTSTFLSSQQQQPLTVVAPSSMITSTPVITPRINILSSAILPSSNVSSSVMSQRIVMPTTNRSSPVNKVSPSKMSAKGGLTAVQAPAWKDPNKKDATNLDFDSPYSPGSSDYEDLFEPPPETGSKSNIKTSKTATATTTVATTSSSSNKTTASKNQNAFDQLFGSSPQPPQYKVKSKGNKPTSKVKPSKMSSKPKPPQTSSKGTKLVGVKMDEDNLKILDELPNSAVEMQVKDKFLKKLNRQERVVEEVKLVLKPHYNKKHVTKEEYKDILRRAVPKICHNKSGEINPKKIQALIEAYVRKVRHSKKVTSSSSVNPQKTQVISNWLSKIN